MFIRYKKNHEKIAMGLLSFMPDLKDIKKLQTTMKDYESDESLQLLLWKEEEIIGVAGLNLSQEGIIKVQHISVNPSFRAQGVGKAMVKAIIEQYPDKEVQPTDDVAEFFGKCDLPGNETPA